MEIRPERPNDTLAIRQVTTAAFESAEHTNHNEAAIVEELRRSGALTLSLVAVADGEILGHVAFSRVILNEIDHGWYGLGPVSVRPDRQRLGIGGALIRQGLARLKQLKAKGCVVLGDPRYYRRFGFENDQKLELQGVPPEYFMRLVFDGAVPVGNVTYQQAFQTP
jgi:putative acetyltransferase